MNNSFGEDGKKKKRKIERKESTSNESKKRKSEKEREERAEDERELRKSIEIKEFKEKACLRRVLSFEEGKNGEGAGRVKKYYHYYSLSRKKIENITKLSLLRGTWFFNFIASAFLLFFKSSYMYIYIYIYIHVCVCV